MQWTGRAGLWDDWLAFQAQAARARREEAARIEREAYERREMLKRWVEISALVVFAAGVIVGLIWVVLMIAQFAN
jgi:hypothetical protein